jgi:hypothetical protein
MVLIAHKPKSVHLRGVVEERQVKAYQLAAR